MNKKLVIFATVIAAFAFACQGADAKGRKHHVDKRLTAVSIGVGAASTATYFAINDWHWHHWNNSSGLTSVGAWAATTVGCMAVSPMVGTLVVGRPLTNHEAQYLVVSCALPIVGGWLVNAAYDAHPEWEPGSKPAHVKKKRRANSM